MQIISVYITCSSRDEALQIGRTTVVERLAACANVLEGMTSVYFWDNQFCESSEAVLLLKSRPELADRLTERICQLHSYDNPCVAIWETQGGSQKYFEWVHQQTAAPA